MFARMLLDNAFSITPHKERQMPKKSKKQKKESRTEKRDSLQGRIVSPPQLMGMAFVRAPIKAKREQLTEAAKALFAARGRWEEAIARSKVTSPMDEEYVEIIRELEGATNSYLAAAQVAIRVCEKV